MLHIAGFEYFDRTAPLMRRDITVDGLDYDYTVLSAIDLGRRVYLDAEFEAGELWASSYVCETAAGTNRFVGLPVFPSRNFRHGFIFVRADSDLTDPKQLAGRRVGVVEYVQTAAVWIRGFLQHDYGVGPQDVHWVTTRQQTHAPVLPAGLEIEFAPAGRKAEQLLLDGDVDAIIGAMTLGSLRDGRVRRLIDRPREVEIDYYRRTGAYPIMHLLGVRRDVYEADPGVARRLIELYERAKQVGQERLRHTSSIAVSLPWVDEHIRDTWEVFGGDPFAYGFAANRRALETLTAYVYEQGLTPRRVAPEELFAPETLDT